MKSGVFYQSCEQIAIIKQELTALYVFCAEINGEEIHCWKDYARIIADSFAFPTSCVESVDVYLDWIRDLTWVERDGYAIIIKNYSKFLAEDPVLKSKILDHYSRIIIPWWQSEVEHCVVGGESKFFAVYLVD